MNIDKEEIIFNIKKHWSNLTWCAIADFDKGLTLLIDSQNSKLTNTKKIKEEIQVLHMIEGGTIINVNDNDVDELNEIITVYGLDDRKIAELLQRKYKWTFSPYYSKKLYLFNTNKLLQLHPNVRKLEISERDLFDAFMAKCSEDERYNVYMDFDADYHNFYAYIDGNEIVALGEFCKIQEEDAIVIVSIITGESYRGKWYGKAVVNDMTIKIIEEGWVPQYSVDPLNTASINLSKSLWYEELLSGYSLAMR